MKKILKILLITMLLSIIYAYALVILNLPDTLIVFEGENININTLYGMNINLKDENYEAMLTSSNIGEASFNEKGKTTLVASLFDIELKDIEVNVLDKTTVIPVGKMAGIKLYTKGVLVVGMSEIEGQKPYENSNIKEGDIITNINKEEIENTNELIECINKSNGDTLNITYVTKGETKDGKILVNIDKVVPIAKEMLAEIVRIQVDGDFSKAEQYVNENFVWTDNMEVIAKKLQKVNKALNGTLETELADKLLAEK